MPGNWPALFGKGPTEKARVTGTSPAAYFTLKTSTGSDPAAEFDSARVCTGSHAFPADPARVPEAFFESYFSAVESTGRGRSRRHPDDIGALWSELRGQRSFPLDDLVPRGTVADAMRICQ